MRSNYLLFLSVIAMFFSGLSVAETYDVGQLNKKFTVETLEVKVGDSVTFTNNDPFFHNVFSLSDASLFDLGSYPKGEFRKVEFEEPGTVDVECAIHPDMTMTIIVKE